MIGSHAAYVYGLQAAHTAVVLDLYTRKVAQCIGHAVRGEPLQLFALKLLYGYDFLLNGTCRDDDLVQTLQTV